MQWIQAPSYTSYILPTIAKKHAFAGFINVTSESNKEVFSPFDTAALRALRELRQDPVSVAAVCVVNPTPIELPTISAPPTSLSTERHPPDWSYYGKTSVELPPLGADSEFDLTRHTPHQCEGRDPQRPIPWQTSDPPLDLCPVCHSRLRILHF